MRDRLLTARAKAMRSEPTEPETRLWLALRAKRFAGVKFRHQKVIAGYIADFFSRSPMLVIELDGDTHAHQPEYDAKRTYDLQALGYTVLRFSNADLMANLEGVLTSIAAHLALPLSQPSPLKGRGL